MSHAKYGKNIQEFVRKFREDKGLTQKELGEMLGIHGQYVSDIERGVNTEKPMAFCARLIKHIDDDRKRYLTDLIMEMTIAGVEKALGEKDGTTKRKRKPAAKSRRTGKPSKS